MLNEYQQTVTETCWGLGVNRQIESIDARKEAYTFRSSDLCAQMWCLKVGKNYV